MLIAGILQAPPKLHAKNRPRTFAIRNSIFTVVIIIHLSIHIQKIKKIQAVENVLQAKV